MIGEVPQPTKPSESKLEVIAQYNKKPAKWNMICDSFKGAIWCTVTVDLMSYVHNLSNCYLIWKKFQTLYRNIGFLEHDAIFFWLSTKTLDNFWRVTEFVNAIKINATWLEKVRVTDLPS